MKKIQISILSLIFFVAIACKKDAIMFYEGPDAISIYLDQYEADSTSYSFALKDADVLSDTVWIKVRLQGAPKDVERTIELEPLSGSNAIEGEDYELPKFILKAGEISAQYPVVLKRTDKLLEDTKKLIVSVKTNNDFQKGGLGTEIEKTVNVDKYTIYFNDFLSKPAYWSSMRFDNYVGEFSQVKFRFMVSVYGIDDFSVWTYGELMNAALNLQNALSEYEAENGILYDENGNRVTF